jgi:hypothetical protein
MLYRAGLLLAVGVAVLAVSPALAGSAQKSAKRTSTVVSKCSFQLKPNRFFKEGCRWAKDIYAVRSGGKLTIRDKSGEPHTVSIVKKSDLPRNIRQVGKCFEGGVCGQLAGAHGFPEGEGPPANPVVNVGAAGFDAPGDSVVVEPKQTTKVDVSAKKGTKLFFMCILHPQMQARINVKK